MPDVATANFFYVKKISLGQLISTTIRGSTTIRESTIIHESTTTHEYKIIQLRNEIFEKVLLHM